MIDTPHFRRPPDHPVTENELAWVEFLRLLTGDRVPASRLAHVQGLRNLLAARPGTFDERPALRQGGKSYGQIL